MEVRPENRDEHEDLGHDEEQDAQAETALYIAGVITKSDALGYDIATSDNHGADHGHE